MANVPKVHPHPVLEANLAAAADLPKAGQAGQDRQATAMPGAELARPRASGSGRGPTNDICPSRTFSSCGVSSRLVLRSRRPKAGDPRIAAVLEDRARLLVLHLPLDAVGVRPHRAELQHPERAAAKADATLAIQRFSPRRQQQDEEDRQHRRREQDQQARGDRHVEEPLAKSVRRRQVSLGADKRLARLKGSRNQRPRCAAWAGGGSDSAGARCRASGNVADKRQRDDRRVCAEKIVRDGWTGGGGWRHRKVSFGVVRECG